MAYVKYHDEWHDFYPISAEAMNHMETQWNNIFSQIQIHTHDGLYYTKSESDAKFFSTTFFSGFDADMLDGNHLSDIITTILPVGSIMVWKGGDYDVPEGWHICDGTNSTPDLRERFVIGAGGSFAVGATGGPGDWNAMITPAGTVVVGNHILTIDEIPSHTHDYVEAGSCLQQTVSTSGETYYGARQSRQTTINEQTVGNGAHNHTTGSSATFNPIDPRPAYYALYYIMKVV
jgi:hypothetical protein